MPILNNSHQKPHDRGRVECKYYLHRFIDRDGVFEELLHCDTNTIQQHKTEGALIKHGLFGF